MSAVEQFSDLFQGRRDIWGAVHGECMRTELTHGRIREHLEADGSVGLYPLVTDPHIRKTFNDRHGLDGGAQWVHVGCTDIDHPDGPDACAVQAFNLVKALKALGIRAFPERTKGKGWHVWIFADEWVPAIVMRRALLAAHQVAGVAPTEVNPKSVDGGKAGNGNYVNLPYAKRWSDMDRRVVVDEDGDTMHVDYFVDQAMRSRVPFETLKRAALLYKEPPKKHIGAYTEPTAEAAELARNLPGLAWTIFSKGVLEGRDRSGTMMRFCHLCAEASIEPGSTKVMLRDLDARLGKFIERSDCEEQLERMVIAAYTKVRS